MRKPRIALVLRRDASFKGGGDSAKVARYASSLAALGFDVSMTTGLHELQTLVPDLIHTFNIDLVREMEPVIEWCWRRKVPYVVSPIHHPQEGVSAYFSLGDPTTPARLLRAIGASVDTVEDLRELRRAKSTRGRFGLVRRSIQRTRIGTQRAILQGASMCLPLAAGESVAIKKEFGVADERVMVVPNGLSFWPSDVSGSPAQRNGVLCVGRVEPRKNQLALAIALAGGPYQVTFVGKPNEGHGRYVSAFLDVVASVGNLRYVPGVDHEALRALFARAQIHFSASWFEVVSQVDLEAVAMGCRPVVSMYGYSSEYFDGAVSRSDPVAVLQDPRSARMIVERELSRSGEVSISDAFHLAWDDVAGMVAEVYRRVLH